MQHSLRCNSSQKSRFFRFSTLLALFSMVFGCTTTTYQIAGYSQRYGSEIFPPSTDVQIYEQGSPPNQGYRVIGAVEIAGGPKTKKGDLIEAALKRARAMGAHALVDVAFAFDEPDYVKDNRKKEFSPGKTAFAVIGGVLVVGLVVAALASDGKSKKSKDTNDETSNQASSDDDKGAMETSRQPLVAVLRARAVRFVDDMEAGMQIADSASLGSVKQWLEKQVTARGERLLQCLGMGEQLAQNADVVLDLDIDSNGRVLVANVEETTLSENLFTDCIEGRFLAEPMEPPPGEGRVSMKLPLHLQSDGTVSAAAVAESVTPVAPALKLQGSSLFLFNARPKSNSPESVRQVAIDLLAEGLMQSAGVEVRTSADINAMLLAEKQKDLVGCFDANCAADIAGAFGVDVTCYLALSDLPKERSFSATIVHRDGTVLARSVVLADKTDSLGLAIDTLVRELTLQLVY